MTNDEHSERQEALGPPVQRPVGRPVDRRKDMSMMKFLRRLFCRHKQGRIVAIEFDGETVYECAACGKLVRKPL